MIVPNASRAYIDLKKLRNYCLSTAHPRGKHKARVFRDVLGLEYDNAEELADALSEVIATQDCRELQKDKHGQRYAVDITLTRHGKIAVV